MRAWALIPIGLGVCSGAGIAVYAAFPEQIHWLIGRFEALDYPIMLLTLGLTMAALLGLWLLFKFGIGQPNNQDFGEDGGIEISFGSDLD